MENVSDGDDGSIVRVEAHPVHHQNIWTSFGLVEALVLGTKLVWGHSTCHERHQAKSAERLDGSFLALHKPSRGGGLQEGKTIQRVEAIASGGWRNITSHTLIPFERIDGEDGRLGLGRGWVLAFRGFSQGPSPFWDCWWVLGRVPCTGPEQSVLAGQSSILQSQ